MTECRMNLDLVNCTPLFENLYKVWSQPEIWLKIRYHKLKLELPGKLGKKKKEKRLALLRLVACGAKARGTRWGVARRDRGGGGGHGGQASP